MEDNLNSFLMEDNLNVFCMEDNLNFLKMGDILNFIQMEDDHNIIVDGRQSQKKIMQPKTIKIIISMCIYTPFFYK